VIAVALEEAQVVMAHLVIDEIHLCYILISIAN